MRNFITERQVSHWFDQWTSKAWPSDSVDRARARARARKLGGKDPSGSALSLNRGN
jgi:hypothetical protein